MPSIPYTKQAKNHSFILFALSTLFFMWGMITCLDVLLVDDLTKVFELTPFQEIVIYLSFFVTFFFMAVPAGYLMEQIGFKNGIITGIIISGFGCMIFYPAAAERSYELFLGAIVMLATGITVLQVGANPYVALIGQRGRGASRLSLVQACNSLGTTVAPIFATGFFLKIAHLNEHSLENMSPAEIKNALVHYIEFPYIMFGAILFGLALFIAFCHLPDIQTKDVPPLVKETEPAQNSIFAFPHLILGALAVFVYVGAEVSIARYLIFHDESLVKYYWGAAMLGRFVGAYALNYVSPRKSIVFCSLTASLLLICFMLINSTGALYAMVAIGLFNSVLFPCIFTMGIDGLGKFTERGSGILVMAIVGGAVIPFVVTLIGGKVAFLILIASYLYMAYYGYKGSRYPKRTNFY